ncbi:MULTISPECIES: hypothetical protein [unclassified Microbacterium]
MPAGIRSDAICCSVRCRQARHRFVGGVGVAPDVGTFSLRLAYADPPYPGLSRRYYEGHDDYAGEVDHARLIEQLDAFDGWALSTSERALHYVLGLCPRGVRVASWHRGERATRSGGPLNAWEPVIYFGGRKDPSRFTTAAHDASPLQTVRVADPDTSRGDRRHLEPSLVDDRHVARIPATSDPSPEYSRRIDVLQYRPGVRTTDPGRVVGAKPPQFARWMFDLLGAEPQDELHDLFPGSGGIQRAWDVFSTRVGDRTTTPLLEGSA